ncbi:MAG TPA: ABC transporter ATP-binding protein [Devosiaceae bacterium]
MHHARATVLQPSPEPVLAVDGLRVMLDTAQGKLMAVDGISFSVSAGKTLCLVGESGCGKSLTCLALSGLLPPRVGIAGGSVRLDGHELVGLSRRELTRIRGRDIATIYQDPVSALNPVMTIGQQIAESLTLHGGISHAAARAEALRLLDLVGIADAPARMSDYPHQLSGGMNQRAMIAIALACKPKLLVADEPTTALDVTIQSQILDLLRDIQAELGTALLLVTHDLGVVAEMADEVAVMYTGRIVERGPVRSIFRHPSHPYTVGLLDCLPRIDREQRLEPIAGIVPSLARLPAGCHFQPRCPRAVPACGAEVPGYRTVAEGHLAACHNPQRALQ